MSKLDNRILLELSFLNIIGTERLEINKKFKKYTLNDLSHMEVERVFFSGVVYCNKFSLIDWNRVLFVDLEQIRVHCFENRRLRLCN